VGIWVFLAAAVASAFELFGCVSDEAFGNARLIYPFSEFGSCQCGRAGLGGVWGANYYQSGCHVQSTTPSIYIPAANACTWNTSVSSGQLGRVSTAPCSLAAAIDGINNVLTRSRVVWASLCRIVNQDHHHQQQHRTVQTQRRGAVSHPQRDIDFGALLFLLCLPLSKFARESPSYDAAKKLPLSNVRKRQPVRPLTLALVGLLL